MSPSPSMSPQTKGSSGSSSPSSQMPSPSASGPSLAGSKTPLEQSSQGVTVSGDYDTNTLAIVGGTLRYDF